MTQDPGSDSFPNQPPEDERPGEAATRDRYERVPYKTEAWYTSRPAHLATLATLHGMTPRPIAHSRVLEIGCGDGGNLRPLAVAYPEAEFIGVDLARAHITSGQEKSDRLDISNLELRCSSFIDIDAGFGRFDYVIAHGLMSWISQPLQHRLLEKCRHHLAPNGILFISYNTYPGWHMLQSVREMLLFHTRDELDVEKRSKKARRLLDFLLKNTPERDSAYGLLIREIDRKLDSDHYFVHEYLSVDNNPFYFRQFVDLIDQHGFQYLAEADHVANVVEHLGPDVVGGLLSLGEDRLSLEQSMDYLSNRRFRQSLLCHGDVLVSSAPQSRHIRDMYVTSHLRTPAETSLESGVIAEFREQRGRTLSVDHPLTKAVLLQLQQAWPASVPLSSIVASARDRVESRSGASIADDTGDAAVSTVCEVLLRAYRADLVELDVSPPTYVAAPSERPLASHLARSDAREGASTTTSLRHRTVALDSRFARELLPLLDGSRTLDDLKEHFRGRVSEEELIGGLERLGELALLVA